MTTYREAIYMCLDLFKASSDDFYFTEDHIAYLLDKCRALLLKQRYGNDPKKHVPYTNYQTVTIQFDSPTNKSTKVMTSKNEVPYLLQLGIPRIVAKDKDYYEYRYELVSRERLPFTGNNKYTKLITYCALNNNNKVLMNTNDSFWSYNEDSDIYTYVGPTEFDLVGIFENPREIYEAQNTKPFDKISELDRIIPIEEGLIMQLIDLVVKELANSVYQPVDETNDNRDDSSLMGRTKKRKSDE